jgi:hypothetical protein
MQSGTKKTFHFQTDANPIGGFVSKPTPQNIPAHASISLPSAGGYVESRGESFNFEQVLSCSAAYTRVSGRETEEGATWSMLTTSVVENLNILEVVTAQRVVSQIAATYYGDKEPEYRFIGSHIDGLRIGGYDVKVLMNPRLNSVGERGKPAVKGVTWSDFCETGRGQAGKLVEGASSADEETGKWLKHRFGWMAAGRENNDCRICQFSLVDGFEGYFPGWHYGHTVVIPEFGRIIFGEGYKFPCNGPVQVSMVRAELGCNVKGQASAAVGVVGGTPIPPI